MSNTSASAVLEHFVEQHEEATAALSPGDEQQQQQQQHLTIDGYPSEPGTGRLADTAGLFGRIKKKIFGAKQKSKDSPASTAMTAFDATTAAGDDWAPYLEAARSQIAASSRASANEQLFDERIRNAMEQERRRAAGKTSSLDGAFDFSEEAAFDQQVRAQLADARFSEETEFDRKVRATVAEAQKRNVTSVHHGTDVFDFSDEIEFDRRVRESRAKVPVRQIPLPPRPTQMSARGARAHRDLLLDTAMAAMDEAAPPTTSGLFRGLRDALTSTVDMKPLSAAARDGPKIPLAEMIADAAVRSASLAKEMGSNPLPNNNVLRITIDKTSASLAMTVAPNSIKGDGIMQGHHYRGLASQTLRKSAFFSSPKGVSDPARASITFVDPLAQQPLTVNVRPSIKQRDALQHERAWFAALPSKKHVLVLRFGPDAKGVDLLEDLFVFYTAGASDTGVLTQQDRQFAHAIVHAAMRGEAVSPDSVTAAPAGHNAYAASVALATALAQHRADTGVALDSKAAGVNNVAATAAQSATFQAFASQAQHAAEEEQRNGRAPQMATAQAHGARLYARIRETANAAAVSDIALHKSLTQAWQALHLQATRGVPQHTARRLDNFSRVSNVTSERVNSLVVDFFA